MEERRSRFELSFIRERSFFEEVVPGCRGSVSAPQFWSSRTSLALLLKVRTALFPLCSFLARISLLASLQRKTNLLPSVKILWAYSETNL